MSSGLKLLSPDNPKQLASKSVNDYFDKLVKNPQTTDNGYQYEIMRISTYAPLPQHYTVSAFKLARAGFFYTGTLDEVQCYSCGVRYKNWKNGDDPLDIHKILNPQCLFLNGGADNAELSVKNINSTAPERPFIRQSQQQELDKLQQKSTYEPKKPEIDKPQTNPKPPTNYRDTLPSETVNRNQSNFTRSLDFTSDRSLFSEPLFKHNTESGFRSMLFQQSDFFNTNNSQSQNRNNNQQSVFNSPFPKPEQSDAGFEDFGRVPMNQEPVVIEKEMVMTGQDERAYARQRVGANRNISDIHGMSHTRQGISPVPYDSNDYRNESARLDSYAGFQSSSGVSVRDMAKSGLYYLGDRDRVQCVFCRGILRNWEAGDVPHEEHAKHFDQCPFILDPTGVGNVPIDPSSVPGQDNSQFTSNVITETAVHQNYSILSERLATYKNFPERKQTHEDLAKAGFFHTGTSDNVKCFFCDGGLRNWEPNDDPFTEHARWFPRCGYLLMSKGQDYIQKVQDKYNPKPTRPPPRRRNENMKRFAVHMSKVNERMRDHLTRLVLDMGLNRETVKKVIIQRMEEFGSDEYFPNAESLYDAVIEYEEEEKYRQEHPELALPHVTADDNEQSPDIEDDKNKKKKKKKNKKNKKPEPEPELEPEKSDTQEEEQQQYQYMDNDQVSQLAEDVNRMKEERTCKICMDEEVNIVFLKCGHLVCCSSCAPSMKHCPICRQPIKGTVRVFLS